MWERRKLRSAERSNLYSYMVWREPTYYNIPSSVAIGGQKTICVYIWTIRQYFNVYFITNVTLFFFIKNVSNAVNSSQIELWKNW